MDFKYCVQELKEKYEGEELLFALVILGMIFGLLGIEIEIEVK